MRRLLAARDGNLTDLVLAAMLVAVTTSAGAQEASVVVSGIVHHDDGSPAPELPVDLEVHDGRAVVYTQQAAADAEGRVSWDAVPVVPGYHARLVTEYEGAEYSSATVALQVDTPVSLEVTVFPVSSAGRPLHLETLHLIVQVDEPGLYRVLQFMTVTNAGDAAHAGGPQLEDGRRAGLVIPLPAGATSVRPAPFPSPAEALSLDAAELGSDRMLDARPVPPDGRQVAVTYDLVPEDGRVDVKLALPYPTQAVSLMIGGAAAADVAVSDTNLEARPDEQIGDQSFSIWGAEALAPGTEVEFVLGAPRLTLQTSHWALIGLATSMVLALAGSLYGGNRPYGVAQRDGIIDAIARLDLQHEADEISPGEYFRRRGREIEKLGLLQAQLGDDRRGGDAGSEPGSALEMDDE